MPIGIISDFDLERELNRNNGSPKAEIKPAIEPGRNNKRETPEEIRKVIAEEVINGADRDVIAEEFNISKSSMAAYANGANSTASYNKPDKDLAKHVNGIKDRIVKKARNRLITALDNITPEKLASAKLKELSTIAKDMSSVVRNIEPASESDAPKAQFIFFAPQQRIEADYAVVQVNE